MKHWRARHFPRAADTKRLRGGQAATVAGYAGPGFHNWPSGHIPQDTDTNPLRRIRLPTKKTFRGPRLCGVPSERGFLFPGRFPGFAPWAGMQCPYRAWNRKRGGGISSNGAAPTRSDAMPVGAWIRYRKRHHPIYPNGARGRKRGADTLQRSREDTFGTRCVGWGEDTGSKPHRAICPRRKAVGGLSSIDLRG